MKNLLVILALLLSVATAKGKERAFGYCEDGNQQVLTNGISSTTLVQRSYPPCRITVYAAGTTNLATICSDNLHPCTPLANPSTSTTSGYWYWYSFNGRYDVRFDSVGVAGCPAGPQCIATPFTHGDYLLCDPADTSDPNPCGSGGSAITSLTRRIAFWYAECNNGNCQASWDLPTSNAMVADVVTDGTNGTVQGVLKAAKSSIAYNTFQLPCSTFAAGVCTSTDFVAFESALVNFTTLDTTQNDTIIFQLQTACSAPNTNTTDTPAYNGVQAFTTVTIPASAVSGAQYSAIIPTVTSTGCLPGDTLHIKLTRSGADTSTDTAVKLLGNLTLNFTGSLL